MNHCSLVPGNARTACDNGDTLTMKEFVRFAIKNGFIPVITRLWFAVVLILALFPSVGMPKATGTIDEQLMEAAKRGDPARVKVILDKGAEINATDKGGTTALIHAADSGHITVVRLLLEKGADVNAKNKGGWTALMWAATSSPAGRTDIVKLLIAKGGDVNAKDQSGMTALLGAARQGHLPVVKVLLEKGANINAKDQGGASALIEASKEGRLDIVKLLLEKGADANARDSEGRTAIMQASERGHSKVADLLRKHSATPAAGPGSAERTVDNNLIGTWELLYLVDKEGNQERPRQDTRTLCEFTDKGQVIFVRIDEDKSDERKNRTGKYALDGNKISITDDVGNTVHWPYQISGDTLVIDMPESKKKFYWGRFR
jgi:ankyrin repeat protein